MNTRFKIAGLAAGMCLMAAVSASAATVSVVANAPESWEAVDQSATTTLLPGTSWTDAPSTVNDSLASFYKSPFDPALADNGSDVTGDDVISGWEDLTYFTVGSPDLVSSPAVLSVPETSTILSLLWGSVDTYNAIEFYLGGFLVDLVSGQDVFDNGGEPAASGAALVNISGIGGLGFFDEVRFYSNFGCTRAECADIPAFEFSNVVAAVPLPAGGLLLISALGGMAALRRKRKAA